MAAGDVYTGTISSGGYVHGFGTYNGNFNVNMTNGTSGQTYVLVVNGVFYFDSALTPGDPQVFVSSDVTLFGPESPTNNTTVLLSETGTMSYARSGSTGQIIGVFDAKNKFPVSQQFTVDSSGNFTFTEQ